MKAILVCCMVGDEVGLVLNHRRRYHFVTSGPADAAVRNEIEVDAPEGAFELGKVYVLEILELKNSMESR